MEEQFKKLLSHAEADLKILHSISGGVSKKKLGFNTNNRRMLGEGSRRRGSRRHQSGWHSPPTSYKGRRLKQNESIHDVYHRELAKYKGNPEDFQEYFEEGLY